MSVEYVDFGFDENETSKPLNSESNRLSLIESYQDVFLNSLYEEDFSYEEVDNLLKEYEEELNYEGVLAVEEGNIIGFAFGFQLTSEMNNEDWRAEHDFTATNSEVDALGQFFQGDTYYFAELGVIEDERGRGIGKDLKREELERVENNSEYEKALMRTNQNNERKIEGVDQPLGFEKLPWKTEVEQRRESGEIEKDTRIWMSKDVS